MWSLMRKKLGWEKGGESCSKVGRAQQKRRFPVQESGVI